MTPTHISINKCSGGCYQTTKSCTATQTKLIQVPVLFGKCGLTTAKCAKSCGHVTIEEDTQCGCACQLGSEDCDSDTHSFNIDLCQCQCKDTISRHTCLDQGRTWSDDTCQCQCNSVSMCSVGMMYDMVTCSCIIMQDNNMTDIRVPRSSRQSFFSWQILVILILLLLVFVLIVTIFALNQHDCENNTTEYEVKPNVYTQIPCCYTPVDTIDEAIS